MFDPTIQKGWKIIDPMDTLLAPFFGLHTLLEIKWEFFKVIFQHSEVDTT